jgi:hypothetical protein
MARKKPCQSKNIVKTAILPFVALKARGLFIHIIVRESIKCKDGKYTKNNWVIGMG